jgi:CheY-like chemotaxis protein
MKILVVEDHADCRELIVVQLKAMGHEVVEAMSGEESLDKTPFQNPDLIIMDLTPPGISGIETTARLKFNCATAHIPILGYTAWDDDRLTCKAKSAGMAGLLTKPTDSQHLKMIIPKLLPPRC